MNAAETCYGTGRRKSSIARVFLKKGSGRVTVNYKDVGAYFTRNTDVQTALSPLAAVDMLGNVDVLITGFTFSGFLIRNSSSLLRSMASSNKFLDVGGYNFFTASLL